MGKSSIEWTDTTWNPVRGCSMAQGSENGGCLNCYAARMAARNLPEMKSPTTGKDFAVMRGAGPRWTGDVELIASKLAEPLHWRKPRKCFVNSMSDLFHEELSFDEIAAVYGVMAACPHVTFQVLTKRPERRREFHGWLAKQAEARGRGLRTEVVIAADRLLPDDEKTEKAWRNAYSDWDGPWPLPNVWEGTSVEDQETADRRIPELLQTPVAVRFVSYEPALGPVDFTKIAWGPGSLIYGALRDEKETDDWRYWAKRGNGLDWIIVGGESGPGARPFDIAWARSNVEQCKAAEVACFVKQMGAWVMGPPEDWVGHRISGPHCTGRGLETRIRIHLKDKKGGNWDEWPADLCVREFPEVARG